MKEVFIRDSSVDNYDWEEKCAPIMVRLREHFDRQTSPFWPYFFRQRSHANSQGLNDLRVLHNYVSTLRELLEELDDGHTLALLEDLEETCM